MKMTSSKNEDMACVSCRNRGPISHQCRVVKCIIPLEKAFDQRCPRWEGDGPDKPPVRVYIKPNGSYREDFGKEPDF